MARYDKIYQNNLVKYAFSIRFHSHEKLPGGKGGSRTPATSKHLRQIYFWQDFHFSGGSRHTSDYVTKIWTRSKICTN